MRMSDLLSVMSHSPSDSALNRLLAQLTELSDGCNHASGLDRAPALTACLLTMPENSDGWSTAAEHKASCAIRDAAEIWWRHAPRFDYDRVRSWGSLWHSRWNRPAGHDRLAEELRYAADACGSASVGGSTVRPCDAAEAAALALVSNGTVQSLDRLLPTGRPSFDLHVHQELAQWAAGDTGALSGRTQKAVTSAVSTVLDRMNKDLRWGIP